MKVFLVHRFVDFSDSEMFNSVLEIIEFFNPNLKVGYLKEAKGLWKKKALKKIKESQLILYIENGDAGKNVTWELKKANNNNKTIYTINWKNEREMLGLYINLMHYLKKEVGLKHIYDHPRVSEIDINKIKEICETSLKQPIPTSLSVNETNIVQYIYSLLNELEKLLFKQKTIGHPVKDKFIEQHTRVDIDTALYNIQFRLEEPNRSNYGLFNIDIDKLKEKEKVELLLEQYKTFVQSSETLMQRRQTVNSFYLTINTALVTIFAAIISLKLQLTVVLFVTFLLCLIGMVTSRSWSQILRSYGILNSSKIKVISLIERQLPVSLFDAEWAVMTSQTNSGNYSPFTRTESKTATHFYLFYLIAGSICLIGFIYNLF